MTDIYVQRSQARQIEQQRVIERPPIRPPYTQRVLNPISTIALQAVGDFPQPWPVLLQVFSVSVLVVTTNNGTNFWTIDIRDSANVVLASVTTAAIAANTWARLSTTTFVQPATTNVILTVVVTPTLTPGNLFAVPMITLLRTGN